MQHQAFRPHLDIEQAKARYLDLTKLSTSQVYKGKVPLHAFSLLLTEILQKQFLLERFLFEAAAKTIVELCVKKQISSIFFYKKGCERSSIVDLYNRASRMKVGRHCITYIGSYINLKCTVFEI